MASSSAQQWVDDDLATLDLGDERRNRRARQMIEGFAQRPGASLTTVFEDRAEIAAGYRLLNNDAVAPDPVSYTHLDVYKRQIPRRAAELGRAGELEPLGRDEGEEA